MEKIAIISEKGGSARTTTAINLGSGLVRLGKAVLFIDMDPQGHATRSLGVEPNKGIYAVLRGELALTDTIIKRNGLSIIVSNPDLAGIELEMSATPGREFILKDALKGLKGHDVILIDCPPSLGLLTIMALTAASGFLTPLPVEFLALDSIPKLMRTIGLVRENLNPGLGMIGILLTRVDQRKRLNREVIEQTREYFKDKVFKTVIRENVSIAEAPGLEQSIFDYSPRSHGAADYAAFAKEFLGRLKK